MNDDYKSLYDAISAKYDIGTYNDFIAKMATSEQRKNFYDAVSKAGFDLGDYQSYEDRLKKKENGLPVGIGEQAPPSMDSRSIMFAGPSSAVSENQIPKPTLDLSLKESLNNFATEIRANPERYAQAIEESKNVNLKKILPDPKTEEKNKRVANRIADNLILGVGEMVDALPTLGYAFGPMADPTMATISAFEANKRSQAFKENMYQADKGFLEAISDGDYAEAATIGLETTARSLPLMALSAVTGGGGLGGYASLAAISGAQSYNEAVSEDWFQELSPIERAGYASAMGSLEAIGESVGGKILKSAAKDFATGLVGKEAFEKTAKEFISGYLKSTGYSMSEEALAEFVTGFGQSITQQAAQNGIDAVDYAQVLKDALESASLGAFGGGTIRTVGYVPSAVAMANSIGVKNSKIKNRKAIEELSQKLETAETEVERTAIVELLDKAIQNDAKDVNRSVKVYELMKNESQQDFDYVYQLDASLRRKISQYEATEDTDIKKALGEDIKRLSGLKEQIENKYDRKEEVGVPSGVREGEAVVAAEPVVREGEKAPEAGRVLQVPAEEVTQEIYNEFVDKGVVPDGAIVSISDKIVSGETLTEQEQAIYKDKSGQIEEQVRLKREQFMTPEEIEAERLRAEKEAPKVEAVKPEDLPVESTSREFIKVVEEQLPTPTQGKFGGYPIMAAGYKKGDELNYKPIKEGGNVLAEVGLQAVSPDVVEVSEFVSIPTLLKEERTGAGTKALKQLTDFADKAGVTLRLTPSPLKQVAPVEGMDTQEALIKFYEEKGGFELREDGFMYYEPKKAAPKAKPAPKKEAKPKAKKAVAGAPAYATNKQSLEKILERQPNITKEQAKATASVMDVMIGKMAEREGISKAQMYDKIGFVKGELPVDKLKAALKQDYKGAMVEDDAKYLIYLMENADVSTPLHEMARVYEKFLTDEEKAEILKWAGNKQWSRETSEKFARGFEKYLAEGKAPQLWLQKIFNKFKMWLIDVYNGVKGSKIDLELSPVMAKIYDSIFLQDKTFEFRRPTQLQGTMDLWIQGLQQKFIGVLRLQEQVENSIGKAVAIGQDFRNAFRLVNGKIADKFDKLKEKYEETALSMKKLKVSQEDLHLFLYANTAAERNAFVKENRDPMNSSGSGMTDVAAERILNEFEEKNLTGKLKESAKSIYDITKDTRKKLVEYGLESQETIDKYEQNFKNYVPLRGFETTGEEDFESIPGFSQRQVKGKRKIFQKKIKGRTTLAGDIIYQVIADNYETIVRGEKNLVLQRLYKFAEEYRDNDVWETLTPKQVGSKKPTKFEAIPVFFNGEAHYIKMRDQRMNEIINESSYESASKLLTFFSAINRFASMMFTTYSPEFWITNFGRDLQAAVFNVLAEQEIEDGLLVGKKILKGIAQESLLSLRTIFAVETTGKSKLKETAKYYEEFKEDGAPTAWIENLHPDKIKNAFDQIAELSDAGTASLMSKKQLSVAANKVSEYVLSVNSAFENAIRLAVYIKARKAGVSREKAAETAKTITIDFNASGTWSRGFNATYLFFNAATQNVARLVRTLGTLKTVVDPVTGKKKKTTTGAQKLAFGIIGFGYLVTQLNIAFSGDDEDELEKYMDVPDYEKTRNIIFYPPKSFRKYLMSLTDEEGYIKLPTTYGYNMFFNFGVAMAELQSGQRSPASAAAFAFNSFIDGILPIQVQTSDKSTLNGFVKTFAPSATKPFIEVLTNEAYNGSPVYREGFPTDKTPRSYKGFERSFTEKSMSEITKTLNDISGGSEYVSGGIDWNPDATVYILNYFGGGPLTFAEKTVNSVDIAYKKAMGESQDVNPNDIPILRRFLGSTNPYGDYETYYERKEEITSLFKEMSDPKAKKDDPDRYKGVDQLYVLLYGVTGSKDAYIGLDDEIKKMFENKKIETSKLAKEGEDPIKISENVETIQLNIGKAVDKFNAQYNKLRGVK